jgi:RNA polymerase sigma factor for flagellar operon FliA
MSTNLASAPSPSSDDDRDRQLEELWRRHRDARDRAAREALVAAYYPLVQHVARRLGASLSDRVELGDLEGYGSEGLLDAIDRFEFGRGAQFTTFAAHRIRGAIYDGLRAADWAPRSVRRRSREINDNLSYLSIEYGRAPTEEEEANALGIGLGALRSSKARIAGAEIASLDQRISGSEAVPGREPSDPSAEPDALVVEREQVRAVSEGVRTLSDRQQTVTQLSFGEGMTLAEIGRLLGVTESRVCQIRAAAIRQLRAHLVDEDTGS